MMIESFKENFFGLVEESNNVVVTAHVSPDDDSIASVLGMYGVLKVIFPNKNIRIIYSGQRVSRY